MWQKSNSNQSKTDNQRSGRSWECIGSGSWIPGNESLPSAMAGSKSSNGIVQTQFQWKQTPPQSLLPSQPHRFHCLIFLAPRVLSTVGAKNCLLNVQVLLGEEGQLCAKKEITPTGGELLNKYLLNAYSVPRHCSRLWMKWGCVINREFLTGQVMVGSQTPGL